MTSQYLDISSQIKALRRKAGLSLGDAASRAGTSAASWSRYESGWSRFEIYTLKKIAGALGCRLTVRFDASGTPATPTGRRSAIGRLRRLFWDRPLKEQDLEEYPLWVLERALEYGAMDDVQRLVRIWGRREFLKKVAQARFQSARTAGLWQGILTAEKIPCTRKHYPRAASSYWIS